MPTNAEPQVTVRNIPQSDYNDKYVPPSSGGAVGGFRQHKALYLIGGIAGIFGLYLLWHWWSNQSNNASASLAGTGVGTGTAPDQLWGSQLDADYQQLTQSMDTNSGLLQQILNKMNNPSNSPGNGGTGVTPTTPGVWSGNPLIQRGQFSSTGPSGSFFNWQGQEWTLVYGGGGRVWGVPGEVPLQYAQQVQIGTGPGQKELLYAPSSYYH